MKKLIITALCLISFAIPSIAAQTDAAETFAKKMADDIMRDVVKAKVPLEQKQKAFHDTSAVYG